jgi:hypothetical protein
MEESEQGQIFQDLIAEGAGSDHQHPRRTNLLLIPPWDQAQAAVAILCVAGVDSDALWRHGLPGRNLWLEAKNVTITDRGIRQGLPVLDLAAGILMVKLVA